MATGAKGRTTMKKLLLAYDGTDPARRALELTVTLARTFGADVTVVSVVPTRQGRSPMDPWDDSAVHAQELLEAGRLLRAEGIEPRLVESYGNVAMRIEELAAAGEFDAIIVGSRGLSMLDRALQGSISEHVAANATTSVIVAR
jgi:nucleotide-binding universal stress UspA family protein